MKIEVVKKDGTLEDYDESKVARVAQAAGLDASQAQTVALDVTKWIKDNSLLKVTSLQIKYEVVESLKKFDKSAADLFVWYEETKDNHEGSSPTK